jgi:bifunctional enzyme CysN/CysC
MDLVDYSEARFNEVVTEYKAFLKQIGLEARQFVPISARNGFNVDQAPSNEMAWYTGPTITQMLDTFAPPKSLAELPLRFPIPDV